MGMVFQYSALFDSMSVGENVAFGLREHTNLSDDKIQHIVDERLGWVGLSGYESYMPNELSGGMKKRVSLARAIALDPTLILYDEPSSGLDPITSGTISMLIRGMQERLGCTSIVVTHDMQSAFYVADRIALLDKGKIYRKYLKQRILKTHLILKYNNLFMVRRRLSISEQGETDNEVDDGS